MKWKNLHQALTPEEVAHFRKLREQTPAEAPVYRRLLGDAYEALPAPIRIMHDLTDELNTEGVATVERGSGRLARALAWLIGFPEAGEGIPVTVTFRSAGGHEHWVRNFAGRSFASWQTAGRGRYAWLMCERFGPLTFAMAVVCTKERLQLLMRHGDPPDRAGRHRAPAGAVALSREARRGRQARLQVGRGVPQVEPDEQAALRTKVVQHLKKARVDDA